MTCPSTFFRIIFRAILPEKFRLQYLCRFIDIDHPVQARPPFLLARSNFIRDFCGLIFNTRLNFAVEIESSFVLFLNSAAYLPSISDPLTTVRVQVRAFLSSTSELHSSPRAWLEHEEDSPRGSRITRDSRDQRATGRMESNASSGSGKEEEIETNR